jgi:hypothetical protein
LEIIIDPEIELSQNNVVFHELDANSITVTGSLKYKNAEVSG